MADTAEISLELQRNLDTVTSPYIRFTITFWDPSANQTMPDSCRNVHCSDVDYTLAHRYWVAWDQKLFTDYEVFNYLGDALHRLNPSDSLQRLHPGDRADFNYVDLWGTKATTQGIRKECYIKSMGITNGGWVGVFAPSIISRLRVLSNSLFDIKGRQIHYSRIPYRPGFAPAYSR